jgi:hypothetical protein
MINRKKLPEALKDGVEALSGMNVSNVRVHLNSQKPAQLAAKAYSQGRNIHLAAGQEQHSSHEAWHVTQQKQGRIQPTMQMKSVNATNNQASLEREADVLGLRALRCSGDAPS